MIRYISFEKDILPKSIQEVAQGPPGYVRSIKFLPISSNLFPPASFIEIYDTGASEEKILRWESIPKYVLGYDDISPFIQVHPATIVINHQVRPGHIIGIRCRLYTDASDPIKVKGYIKYE